MTKFLRWMIKSLEISTSLPKIRPIFFFEDKPSVENLRLMCPRLHTKSNYFSALLHLPHKAPPPPDEATTIGLVSEERAQQFFLAELLMVSFCWAASRRLAICWGLPEEAAAGFTDTIRGL